MEDGNEVVVDQSQVEKVTSSEVIEETTAETPETAPEKQEHEVPKGVQKRIDRAVRQKYEAEARAKVLEERVAAMEARQSQPQQRSIEKSEPTIDKFDNFDDYVAAKAEFIAERKINQTLSERENKQKAATEAAERLKTVDSWSQKVTQATAELPDFEDVIASSDVPMTEPMQQAIMESDIGPKLAYYLANNPEEAVKIANMSPASAIRSLGRIEERLATQKPAVKATSAPEPLKTVGTRAVVSKDPNKMSDAEFAAWRHSQIKARA